MLSKKIRQIALDTETTGLSTRYGHRIIEIGCVELINRRLTGNTFHTYINPKRPIDEQAIEVHGISNEFLQNKPIFAEIVDDYLEFTKGDELIIHNATFDVGFLNYELSLLEGVTKTVEQENTIFDTLPYARKKHPGARASLDALCKRYGIDNSHRELHGALLDANILAKVYISMTGGQFSLLSLTEPDKEKKSEIICLTSNRKQTKVIQCTIEELEAHKLILNTIEKVSGGCVWNK